MWADDLWWYGYDDGYDGDEPYLDDPLYLEGYSQGLADYDYDFWRTA